MERLYPWLAVALCVIAVLVDFASKFMSIVVDGVLLALVVGIIIKMNKQK